MIECTSKVDDLRLMYNFVRLEINMRVRSKSVKFLFEAFSREISPAFCFRVFKMRLTRDTSLFHENVVFEGSNGRQIAFDPLHAYSGTLEGM